MNIKKFENFEIFKDDEFASDVKTLKANKYNI